MVSTTQMASADHQLLPAYWSNIRAEQCDYRSFDQPDHNSGSQCRRNGLGICPRDLPTARLPSNLRRNIINVSGNASNPPRVTERAMPSTQCSGGSTIVPMIMNIEGESALHHRGQGRGEGRPQRRKALLD